MNKHMLTWQGYARVYTCIDEYMSEVVELVKEAFSSLQGSHCDHISMKNVAKIHKCCQALHYFGWDVTGNSSNVDLFHVKYS